VNVILAATGSVAAIRTPRIAARLADFAVVRVVGTPAAEHFFSRADDPWPADVARFSDRDEWAAWNRLGDPVLHIDLRKWADALAVAPASADFLAKAAGGIADNLLLSICRAWDFAKPFVVAPAMNTFMWRHPATQEHLSKLTSWGVQVVPPVEKELACGDLGVGGLAAPEVVAEAVRQAVARSRS
jgi:phosphopantothenoylcysteine decarboxylase